MHICLSSLFSLLFTFRIQTLSNINVGFFYIFCFYSYLVVFQLPHNKNNNNNVLREKKRSTQPTVITDYWPTHHDQGSLNLDYFHLNFLLFTVQPTYLKTFCKQRIHTNSVRFTSIKIFCKPNNISFKSIRKLTSTYIKDSVSDTLFCQSTIRA